MPTIPSLTFQKTVAKQIAETTMGPYISDAKLQKIFLEIESAPVIVTDPNTIKQDHEAGFVGTDLASQIRMYPEGEAEKAKVDHAERAARILAAQTSTKDLTNDPDAGIKQKQVSQTADLQDDGGKAVRE